MGDHAKSSSSSRFGFMTGSRDKEKDPKSKEKEKEKDKDKEKEKDKDKEKEKDKDAKGKEKEKEKDKDAKGKEKEKEKDKDKDKDAKGKEKEKEKEKESKGKLKEKDSASSLASSSSSSTSAIPPSSSSSSASASSSSSAAASSTAPSTAATTTTATTATTPAKQHHHHQPVGATSSSSGAAAAAPVSGRKQLPEKMPGEAELNRLLEDLMDDLGFEAAQRENLRKSNNDAKWKLITNHFGTHQREEKKQKKADGKVEKGTPEYYAAKLQANDYNVKELESLRVSLSNEAMGWLISFIESQGLTALLQIIYDTIDAKEKSSKSFDIETMHLLFRCLKIVLNTKHGINAVFKLSGALDKIAVGLLAPSLADRKLILEILSVFCFVNRPIGHKLILKTMDFMETYMNEKSRFQTVVTQMAIACTNMEDKECLDYLGTGMLFINSVIHEVDDLDFRIHLRNQLYVHGLSSVLKTLQTVQSAFVVRQVSQFEEEMKDDYEEILIYFDSLSMDLNDAEEIFQMLQKSVKQSTGEPHFLSLLQHLLLIRSNPTVNAKYWQLIDEVIKQIVLDGKGIDPDFTGKYRLNVDKIIAGFVDKDRVQNAEAAAEEAKLKLELVLKDKERLGADWTDKFYSLKSSLEENVFDAVAKLQSKENMLHDAEAIVAEQKTVLVQKSEIIERLEGTVNQNLEIIASLRATVETLTKGKSSLESQISDLEEIVAANLTEMSSLREQVGNLEESLRKKSEEFNERSEQFEVMSSDFHLLRGETDKTILELQEANYSLQNRATELETQLNRVREEKEQMEKSYKDSVVGIDEAAKGRLKELEQILHKTRDEVGYYTQLVRKLLSGSKQYRDEVTAELAEKGINVTAAPMPVQEAEKLKAEAEKQRHMAEKLRSSEEKLKKDVNTIQELNKTLQILKDWMAKLLSGSKQYLAQAPKALGEHGISVSPSLLPDSELEEIRNSKRQAKEKEKAEAEKLAKLTADLEAAKAEVVAAKAATDAAVKAAEEAATKAAAAAAATAGGAPSGPPPPPEVGGGPPPPPPPGMGGPPPPPPPPGMGGPPPPPPMFGGPPPPPGFGPPAPAPSPYKKAQSSMKPLHWTKLPPSNLATSLWKKNEIDIETYNKAIDFGEFEDMFGVKKAKAAEQQASGEEEKEKKNQKISVLDGKRAYNCSIMLTAYKMPFPEIRKKVMMIDDNFLQESTITQLSAYVPTPDEISNLMPFQDDPSQLAFSDQFFLTMSNVPRYEERLQCLIYRKTFKSRLSEIMPMIGVLTSASLAVQNSRSLQKFLEVVLILGNYMNGNNASRGDAAGFKLNTITKLMDVKSPASGQVSLLHYIVEVAESKFKECMLLPEDLSDVTAASKITFSALLADVKQLKSGMEAVEQELETYHQQETPDDRFRPVFQEFLANCKTQITELDKRVSRFDDAYRSMLEYFAEDAGTVPEEFFSLMSAFIASFERAKKENHDRKERKVAQQKRLAAQEEKEARRKARTNVAVPDLENASQDKKGLMDDMLQTLKSGDAFGNRKAERKARRPRENEEEGSGDGSAQSILKEMSNF